MSIKIVAGGRKHRDFVLEGVLEYEKRLKKPFDMEWEFVEEGRLAEIKLKEDDFLVVLDERGENITSPELANKVSCGLERGRRIVFVIGGAYGVPEELRDRADFVWSLSKLVFPHEICRLLVIEQIYRAQEIYLGRAYHH